MNHSASADVAQLKRDEMSRILGRTGVLLRPDELSKWRPTVVTRGTIGGMPCAVTCLATDGNLAIFETSTAEGHTLGQYFLGHIQHFQWSESVVSMIMYYDPVSRRHRMAKITKDSGAPGPLYSMPKPERAERPPKARSKMAELKKKILDSI